MTAKEFREWLEANIDVDPNTPHEQSFIQSIIDVTFKRGYHVSFTGVVTFKNADAARRAARAVPVEKLMLETDCPYMSPEPMRKQKVNEPALMVHTARLLAEVKGLDFAKFAAAVTETSRSFFGLPLT